MFDQEPGFLKRAAMCFFVLGLMGVIGLAFALSGACTTGEGFHGITFVGIMVGGASLVYVSALFLHTVGTMDEKIKQNNDLLRVLQQQQESSPTQLPEHFADETSFRFQHKNGKTCNLRVCPACKAYNYHTASTCILCGGRLEQE